MIMYRITGIGCRLGLSLVGALVLGAAIAQAQELGPAGDFGVTPSLEDRTEPGWRFSVGAGLGLAPDYEGSDEYELVPLISARAQREEIFVAFAGTELIANVLPHPVFRLGPLLRFRAARDDVDEGAVDRLADVDMAVELGAFAGFDLAGWQGSVEIARDVADAHDGLVIGAKLAYTFALLPTLPVTAAAFTTWAGDNYMQTYFGISPADAARSGLSPFDAESGFKNVGLNLELRYRVTGNWALVGLASYARLLGDAADSPVTDDVGSANQVFGGLLLTYAF
jgi:MipA family protein